MRSLAPFIQFVAYLCQIDRFHYVLVAQMWKPCKCDKVSLIELIKCDMQISRILDFMTLCGLTVYMYYKNVA